MAKAPEKPSAPDHWLVRPQTIRLLWIGFIAILAATILVDLLIEHHAEFGIEGTIGFGAWFGFGACAVMVIVARVAKIFLKRPEDYYGD